MKRSGIVVIAAMLAALTTTAQAREPGWYLGIGAGQPDSDDSYQSKASTGFKYFGGYDFSGPLSAELTYVDFGKFESEFNTGIYQASSDKGLKLSVLASVSATPELSLYGKLGVFAWQHDISGTFALVSDKTTRGTSAALGFGLQYMATRNIGLRVEYEYFNDVAGSIITMPSVSVIGHF